jgi:hypothetical protein
MRTDAGSERIGNLRRLPAPGQTRAVQTAQQTQGAVPMSGGHFSMARGAIPHNP